MNRAIIFITGMSGSGKSTILDALSKRSSYTTIDTDYDQLSIEVFNQELLETEWIWDEGKLGKIISEHKEGVLLLSGTVSNQGKFYSYFTEIIYLSAPLHILLERVQNRTTNDYGKSEAERNEIIANYEQFGEMIEAVSTRSIDATREISSIVDEIDSIAQAL